jgi:ribosome maturation factor RimP
MKNKEDIIKVIKPLVERENLLLKSVSFESFEGKPSLVVSIDAKDSDDLVTLDDCAKISRIIDPVLEKEDMIEKNSFLVVSSPGVTRRIKSGDKKELPK